jgi:tetratricopeptide (TPR) repeat protein
MGAGEPPPPDVLSEARNRLAQALAQAPTDLNVLFLAFQFHCRLGELDPAEQYAQLRLDLAAPDSADAARAFTNLGIVAHLKNDQDRAEQFFARAIDIDRRTANLEALARDLGNSALVPEARGNLAAAESIYHESLAIARSLKGPFAEELVAGKLANLGDIAKARGQIDEARALWTQARQEYQRLGIKKWDANFRKRFAELGELQPGA